MEDLKQARVLKVDLRDPKAVTGILKELVDLLMASMESHLAIGVALEHGDVKVAKITAELGYRALHTRRNELFGEPVSPEAMDELKKSMLEAKHKTDPRYNN